MTHLVDQLIISRWTNCWSISWFSIVLFVFLVTWRGTVYAKLSVDQLNPLSEFLNPALKTCKMVEQTQVKFSQNKLPKTRFPFCELVFKLVDRPTATRSTNRSIFICRLINRQSANRHSVPYWCFLYSRFLLFSSNAIRETVHKSSLNLIILSITLIFKNFFLKNFVTTFATLT